MAETTLYHLRRHLRTPELCLLAVQRDGSELLYVPPEVMESDPEVIVEALKQNGVSLGYCPGKFMQQEYLSIALLTYADAIYIKSALRRADEQTAAYAVSQDEALLGHLSVDLDNYLDLFEQYLASESDNIEYFSSNYVVNFMDEGVHQQMNRIYGLLDELMGLEGYILIYNIHLPAFSAQISRYLETAHQKGIAPISATHLDCFQQTLEILRDGRLDLKVDEAQALVLELFDLHTRKRTNTKRFESDSYTL